MMPPASLSNAESSGHPVLTSLGVWMLNGGMMGVITLDDLKTLSVIALTLTSILSTAVITWIHWKRRNK